MIEDSFTEIELKEIVPAMRRIEPGFKNWSDSDILNLTSAVKSCGYQWTEEDKHIGFFNPKNELILNIKGLHHYTPESIVENYETTWSKDSARKRHIGELKVKGFKAFWTWIISFSILFFVKFSIGGWIIAFLFVRFLYHQLRYYRAI